MRTLPSGTVTLLFTDIEGSTRQLNELGREGFDELLREHRRILREAFASHRGVELRTEGDSFFAVFGRAEDAVAAAEQAQASLTEAGIPVRIGIHTGEPLRVEHEDGYVGLDVHRGARIAGAAHGGQVLLSQVTRELLRPAAPVLRDLGRHRLRDLAQPERLYQLGDIDFPPLRSLNASNLPAQPTSLVGRECEVADVLALVRSSRLVTVVGAGGSGKTRLALEAAAQLAGEFEDGVFWVPLAAVSDSELVLPTIAAVVGAKRDLAAHLDEGHALFLLDNLEQILSCGPSLAALMRNSPNVRLLATSRAPLRIGGEQEYEVPLLPVAEATELFTQRARQVNPAFEPDEHAGEICRSLAGLPLALELAAVRTELLSTKQILERLGRSLELLTSGAHDAPERQQTLRATIAWSYDLLTPAERRVFEHLAVFAGSFELEAAEAVASAGLDELGALVGQSIIRQVGDGRFFMLETIGEYANERLEERGDAEELRRKHAHYFLRLAEETEPEARGPREADWLSRLKSDQGNFRAALSWSLEHGETELALGLAGSLHSFWYHAGFLAEGRRWAQRALEIAVGDELPRAQARALSTAGEFANLAGETEAARGYLERSLLLYQRAGDTGSLPAAYTQLGHVALHEGDPELARSLYEQVLAYESTDPWCTPAVAYCNLGVSLVECGRLEEARSMLERGLAEARGQGSRLTSVALLQNLAWAALLEHDLSRCASLLRESYGLLQEVPDPQLIWEGLELGARLAAVRGSAAEAARLCGAASARRHSLGVASSLPELLAPRDLFDQVRLEVGDAVWEREWQLGEALGPEEALEEALKALH
jgi:predicted ATPase/class 3 adenylate cyclase